MKHLRNCPSLLLLREAHGSSCKVESSPGSGSVFSFALPAEATGVGSAG